MRSKALIVVAFCLLGSTFALGQRGDGQRGGGGGGRADQPPPPPFTLAPDIPGVVAGGTKVMLIKEGFNGAQGATQAPDGSFLFTERMANKITKIDKDDNISSYMEDTSATNSFSFDAKGRAIGVQWMPAGVAVLAPTKMTLADKFENHGFGRPNDLTIDKKGGVYFTDDLGIPADMIKPAVYYVKPAGGIIKIADDIARPNGLILSPDERTLYVLDTNGDSLRAFDVQADGSTKNERSFATIEDGVRKTDTGTNSGADGGAIDGAGRLYVTSNAGVQVFSPQGKHLGSIPTPRQAQNLAFAGPDKKTLYVLGGNAVYKISMLAEGYKGRAK
jgi:gluconolactonase